MKIKLPRHHINELSSVHGKLCVIDFDNSKEAITHIKEAKLIDGVIEENKKLQENVVKKFKINEKSDQATVIKANTEITKILLEGVELEITEYKEHYVNQIKLSPREAMILEQTKLFKFEEDVTK